MMHPQGSTNAKSIRDRATRLADSVRNRVIAISFVTSSSPMANSATSRGAAMMQGLVQNPTHRFHGIGALVYDVAPGPIY
jgi:hypothetical protein